MKKPEETPLDPTNIQPEEGSFIHRISEQARTTPPDNGTPAEGEKMPGVSKLKPDSEPLQPIKGHEEPTVPDNGQSGDEVKEQEESQEKAEKAAARKRNTDK